MAISKLELQKAIENGESVWVAHRNAVLELCPDMSVKISNSDMPDVCMTTFEVDNGGIVIKGKTQWTDLFFHYDDISKNKAVAEHYAFHKNVTRTETLPFLTWEEFLSEVGIGFISAEGFGCCLYYDKADDMIYLDKGYETDTYGATEANFYKAYDECVRMFRREEKLWKEQYIKEQS